MRDIAILVVYAVFAAGWIAAVDQSIKASTDGQGVRPGQSRPGAGPITSRPAGDAFWPEMLDYIHFRESSCGRNPKAKGNEYQLTAIFLRDCDRLFGSHPDKADNAQCRVYIRRWLEHYCPGVRDRDALYRVYRHGPKGATR